LSLSLSCPSPFCLIDFFCVSVNLEVWVD
jgi:hypothetical protein